MPIASPPAPVTEVKSEAPARVREFVRGLTVRSFTVSLFALFLLGIWVEYEERYNNTGGPIAENAPPSGAVGIILIILLITAGLYLLRRSFRLQPAELVVIYTALLVAAPLMTQGMWTRLFGLMSAIPRAQDFKTYEALPPQVWPHGSNLIKNGRFTAKLDGFTHTGGGSVDWQNVEWKKRKTSDCPVLSNDGKPKAESSLTVEIPRKQLVPGEQYLFSCLVKTQEWKGDSVYFMRMQADNEIPRNLLTNTLESTPTFSLPSGFRRIGVTPVTVPPDIKQKLTLSIGLMGEGKLTVQDVEFINVMAVMGGYTGTKVARAHNLKVRKNNPNYLEENERDFTIAKPDNMFSLPGLRYLLIGFIPLAQWVQPVLAWLVIVGALFLGFFGFNVLMRRQWVEHERFTFPLNTLPRLLFGSNDGDDGVEGGIFHNKLMWIGFILTLPILILKGLQFYYPSLPQIVWSDVWNQMDLKTYITNPTLQLYFTGIRFSVIFSLLSIALLVQTDLLFSIWATYLLYMFLPFFGTRWNLQRYEGYPWQFQQASGAFIAYAVLAIVAARRHLANIFRHVFKGTPLDDSEEIVTYRTALWCVVGSLVLFMLWGRMDADGCGCQPALLWLYAGDRLCRQQNPRRMRAAFWLLGAVLHDDVPGRARRVRRLRQHRHAGSLPRQRFYVRIVLLLHLPGTGGDDGVRPLLQGAPA